MNLKKFFGLLILSALISCGAVSTFADVKLPALVGDNMVLQRDLANSIWGWAEPGEEVSVQMSGQTKKTVAGEDGKWLLKLDPMKAGGPFEMTIKGKNEIKLKNVLIGEVWVCSGQSNMEWPVKLCDNPDEEIKNAHYPNIRLITVPKKSTTNPQDDFVGAWVECSPKTVADFSAVGYFFGRKLSNELNVPVGLINSSWGGSACESWINPEIVDQFSEFRPIMERKIKKEEDSSLDRNNLNDNQNAGYLYNGMIVPLKKYGIRGAIWYQGETNAGRAYQYRNLFPLMIQNWRNEWGQGDFSFYFVQLANFITDKNRTGTEPREDAWAELREAQSMTLRLPNTGEAVSIDIGDPNDIHPRNKQDVGLRLALHALARDYRPEGAERGDRGGQQGGQGQQGGRQRLATDGPRFQSLKIEGDKAVVNFQPRTANGLKAKEGELKGFAIAGTDRKFYWADAKMEGNRVVVSSADVPQPVAVRYGWSDNPSCNLVNGAGLPASPFRTDFWPGVTVNNK